MKAKRRIRRRGHLWRVQLIVLIIAAAVSFFIKSPQVIIIIFLLALTLPYLCSFNCPDGKHQKKLLQYGDPVEATVVSFSIFKNIIWYGSPVMPIRNYSVEVRYLYKDKTYNGRTSMNIPNLPYANKMRLNQGQKVTAYVNPDNPQDFIVYELSAFEVVT